MDKNTKNVIEAGITPEEFKRLITDPAYRSDYLEMWPDQDQRYYHLYELAELRGLPELAQYYKERSAPPAEYYFEGEQ